MAQKSISEETPTTDFGVNNQPILLQNCQKKRNEWLYDIVKESCHRVIHYLDHPEALRS